MEPGGFDVAALDEWIGDRLPGRAAPLRATRMGQGTGEANALYWLRRGRHVWVLRHPPAVINAPGASDMLREWRILTALEGTSVPHPAPLLLGGADSPLGTPFLIMERVEGFTPVGVLPAPYDHPPGRRELSFALVDALAELARVPWQARVSWPGRYLAGCTSSTATGPGTSPDSTGSRPGWRPTGPAAHSPR